MNEKENEAISVKNLTKTYRGGTTALDDVSLSVGEGELFGLLGVNGAGKSTLIKILSGLILPSSGTATVMGYDVRTETDKIRAVSGISPQETAVAPNLTVEENLRFFAELYGTEKEKLDARVSEISESFSLTGVMKRRARTLSGGYQRRLSVAIALICSPRVLYLDEPTLGLDVIARRELWKIISSLRGKMTVILTSHYLEEIEALCDRVAVMSCGHVLALGTVGDIKTAGGSDSFEDAFINIVGGGRL